MRKWMHNFSEYKLANIFLVEDNIFDIEYIKSVLKINNIIFNLKIFRDGQEILYFLENIDVLAEIDWPNLIILDLNLPKIDGSEILKIIQKNETLKQIPIFILSGSHFEEDTVYSYKNGAKFYMHKPFNINQFLQNIEKVKNIKIIKGDSLRICRV